MILTKLSSEDKKNLSMELLRVLLAEEEEKLKDRLIDEKKEVAFYQGAAFFCRSLRKKIEI